MKAIVYERYGEPDVLTLREIPVPVPRDNQVLVRVFAASINSWDWDMIRGEPWIVRMWGLLKPRFPVPGADIAGRVEAVGKKVTKFKPGDDVFGDIAEFGWGAFAEFACAPENALALKSLRMTYEQAAAIPQAGMMAVQSVYDKGDIKPGERMLFNGAGGGVGTLAIQLAKLAGATVTAVDCVDKHEMLRRLGADHVNDYRTGNFVKRGETYDLVIDVVSNRPLWEYKRALNPGGRFLMIGGTMSVILQAMVLGRLVSRGNKSLGILAYRANKDLDYFSKLFEEGKIKPVVDRVFALHETADAFRYYATGGVKGKVIIKP